MFLLPHSVSGYTLQRKLGTGGVAESYLGTHDAAGGRQVVVRRVLPFVLRDAGRLASIEARIRDLLGVRHPFLVHVVDHVVEAEEHFVVEEYVNGVTLEQVLNWCRQSGHVVPPNVFLNIATQICNGLEALHGRTGKGSSAEHVLHLALKPSAIFVSNEGKVLVGSYGLTRSPTSYPQGGVSGPVPARMEYLSPEQTHPDQKLGPASDVFALGALLYELLTLESLFRAESNLQTIHRVRRAEVTSSLLKVKERMPGLDKVLFRALSLNPRHRYQRAFVLREDLRGLMAGYSFATIGEDTRTFLQPILAGAAAPGSAGYVVGLDDAPESPMGADAFADSPPTRIDPDPMSTAAQAASALAERVANERATESAPENTERTDIHPEGDLTPLPFALASSPSAAPTWSPDADPPSNEVPIPGGNRASKKKKKDPPAPAPLAVPEPPPRVDPPFRASPPTLAPALSPFSAPPGPSPLGAALPPAASSPTLSPETGLPSPSELGTAAFAMPAPAPVHPEPEPDTLLAIAPAGTAPASSAPAPQEAAPEAPVPSAANPLPGRYVPPPGGQRPLLGRPVPPPSAAPQPRPPSQAPPPAPTSDSLYDAPPPSRGPLFATFTMLAFGGVLLCSGALYWGYGTWSHIQSVEGTPLAEAAPAPAPVPAANGAPASAASPSAAPPKIEPITDDPASVLASANPSPAAPPAPEPVQAPAVVKAPEPVKPPEPVKAPPPAKVAPAPTPAPAKAVAPTPKPAPVVAKAPAPPVAKATPPPKPKPEPEPVKVVAKVTPPPRPPEPAKPAAVKTVTTTKTSKGTPPPVVGDASLTVLEPSSSTALDSFVSDARAGRLTSVDVASLEATGAADSQYTRSRALLMMNAQKKGDDAAVHRYLDQAMVLPENQYNPVFLADYARWHVNRAEYDRALEKAEKAERYWARLPSELVFTKKAEIYEIEAAAWQGKFYKSGEDLELLENAVRGWEKVRAHAATKDRTDLVKRADTELTKLNDIRARLQ